MDTPKKNRIPISKLEDSPVFNYISNLSPLEPIKSAHNDHSFNSISYSSPPPVFTSPDINLNKALRFRFQRHHFLDSTNKSLSVRRLLGNEESNVAVEVINTCVKQCEDSGECSTEPSKENSELAIKGPEAMKHDSGGPDSNQPCHIIEMDALQETSQMVNSNECTIDSEEDLRKICWAEKHKEAEGCDGMALISDNLSNFSLSLNKNNSVEQDHKTIDPGAISFVSSVLNVPQDNSSSCQKTELTISCSSCKNVQMGELTSQSREHCYVKEKSVMSSTLSAIPVEKDSNARRDENGMNCAQSKQSCGISRRSLIFGGAPSKNPKCDFDGSLTISEQHNCMDASNKKHGIQLKIGSSYLSSVLPGIGLHLNALATSSNGKVIKCKTSASEKQLSMPNIVYSCNSSISGQNGLTKCLTSSTTVTDGDLDSSDSEAKMKASSPQALCSLDELENSSPKRKRYKFETNEENGSCKRCNCKRSKCLKLYCECFAAGLYCIEPCACQDCFNKPIHENTVLETRRLIESRNPLAFAPKVIRKIDAVPESRDNSNTTPASARHKQGCNCRKSSCLKKYCECFQGGVGCSFSCRCIGCKNTYGQRDGFDDMENEMRELEMCKKNTEDMDVEKELPDAPKLQKETVRTSFQIPHTISGKRSISSLSAVGSSLLLCTSQNPRTSNSSHLDPMSENQVQMMSDAENSSSTSPNFNSRKSGRKLILRSIPSFPSLAHPQEQ